MTSARGTVDKLLMVITLAVATTGAWTLQCYQCMVTAPSYGNETRRLCAQFDHSHKFIVECPYSTMCVKRDIALDVQNGVEIRAVIRDCASQKYQYQTYVGGHWEPRTEVLEPYEEGCQETDDKGARIAPTRHCYCRGYLCNSAPSRNKDAFHTDAMAVILVFNLLKYIRSIR